MNLLGSLPKRGPTKTTCDSELVESKSSAHANTLEVVSVSPLRGATTYVGHSKIFRDPMIIWGSCLGFLRDGILGPSV